MALKFLSLFSKSKTSETKEEVMLPLYLTNTLTGKKEEFAPIQKGKVSLYSCGPTVYDYATIGNMRSYMLSDILRRTLEFSGYKVKQVINITDVGHLSGDNAGDADSGEDKIEKGAAREGKKVKDIVKHFTDAFLEDLSALNVETKETLFPKATDEIHGQVMLAKTLEEKGYAYLIEGDGLYFDTSRFADYGALRRSNTNQEAGARITNDKKRSPEDFALWRLTREGESREQEWDSPWGKGFPGWHLECTALIFANLGKHIDIHTGGEDHVAVHHTNEIAQAEAATGRKYVNYWLHNAFLNIEGKKISKSLGNTLRIKNLTDRSFSPLALRYLFLGTHYRKPMNFTWEALEGAQTSLTRLHRFFVEELPKESGTENSDYVARFRALVSDDLDTPKTLALLQELIKDSSISPEDKRATILKLDSVLGLGFAEGSKRLSEMLAVKVVPLDELPKTVQNLVEKRETAREKKDWERADELREKLVEKGYSIKDTSEGPEIEKSN